MKYIDADQIRAEIERRITDNTFGAKMELIDILAFIDTLPEQPVEGLEDEISRYLREECSSDDEPSVSEIARHFAEWQKEQDTRDMFMSDGRNFQKCYELGKKDMKAKMLEQAVKADIMLTLHDKTGDLSIHTGYLPKELGIKYGDKVKIIIIKENEK